MRWVEESRVPGLEEDLLCMSKDHQQNKWGAI